MKIAPQVSAFCGILFAAATALAQAPSAAQLDQSPISRAQALAAARAIEQYWTPERMADAIPMSRQLSVTASAGPRRAVVPREPGGERALPGYASGWNPKQREPFHEVIHVITPDNPLYGMATGVEPMPMHGVPPGNPRLGPYGPFQRWTEFAPITAFPTSTLGKLFFTLNGLRFQCSATVIGRNTLITAGHCNSNGAGVFATDRLFCPSFNVSPDPTRGCWAVIASATSAAWHSSGDPDYDYSCLVTQPTGTVIANSIGNVTGWMGRAWNFSPAQAERTFGYPAAPPFNGGRLISTASTEWYNFDFVPGGQVSKIIGSDLTGGASGGSWVLGWGGAEFPDSDGNLATDPGFNAVNGVNSHKRCAVDCRTPPIDTNGVFWQEMTSPPFLNTAAGDESEDIIAACFAAGGM